VIEPSVIDFCWVMLDVREALRLGENVALRTTDEENERECSVVRVREMLRDTESVRESLNDSVDDLLIVSASVELKLCEEDFVLP
jgi:hypothetical protein